MSDFTISAAHPGSSRDMTLKNEPVTPVHVHDELQEPQDLFVVPVEVIRQESPAFGYPQSVVMGANNLTRLLLPQDPLRRNALVLAVDNDVYLCGSLEIAQQVAGGTTSALGFYLPKSILMAVPSKGAVWAACTTSSGQSRISVFVSRDE